MNVIGGVSVLICILVSGCAIPVPFPRYHVVSPEVHGRVINSETRQPISGVRVNIKGRNKDTKSKRDGSFVLGKGRDFYFLSIHTPCPVYYFPDPRVYETTIVITKRGYWSKMINLSERMYQQYGDKEFHVGDVLLERRDVPYRNVGPGRLLPP